MLADKGVLTADEVGRARERRLLVAALRRCAPRANTADIEAQAFRIQSLAHFATLITPPAEAQRQLQRLLRAADAFHQACLDIAPDALNAVDGAGKLRILQAQSISGFVLGAIESESRRAGFVRSDKTRAAVVSDAVAVAFRALAGKEATIARLHGDGSGSGPALLLAKEVFRHFGLDDDPEIELEGAIERRTPAA